MSKVVFILGVLFSAMQSQEWQSVKGPYYARIGKLIGDPRHSERLYACCGKIDYRPISFVTSDGGVNWTQIPVSILAVDPFDPTTVYASGYKSTDGGITWNTIPLAASVLVVSPHNRELLFASTGIPVNNTNSGVYRSLDGGLTWLEAGEGLPAGITVLSIQLLNHDFASLFVGTSNGVYYSDNVGEMWHLRGLDSRVVAGLGVSGDSSEHLIASGPDGLFSSNDMGSTWSTLLPGLPITALAADSADASRILVGTDHALVETRNGGSTWDTLAFPGHSPAPAINDILISSADPALIMLATESGFYVSTDGGKNWDRRTEGMLRLAVVDMAISPMDSSILAIGEGGIYSHRSTEQGWEFVSGREFDAFSLIAVHPRDRQRVFISSQNVLLGNSIYRSTNGGKDWSETPVRGRDLPFSLLYIDPNQPDTIYATAWSSAPSRSTDGGESWAEFPFPEIPFSMCVQPNNSNVIYVAGKNGTLYKSSTGGMSWNLIPNPDPLLESPGVLAISPQEPQTVCFAKWGGGLHLSSDGGTSWNDVSGSASGRHFTLVAFSSSSASTLLAATREGELFNTTDLGITWNDFTSDAPELSADSLVWATKVLEPPWFPGRFLVGLSGSANQNHRTGVFEFAPTTGLRQLGNSRAVSEYTLNQNYPNPFNSETTISFLLPAAGLVKLEILDIMGRPVVVPFSELLSPGTHRVVWNGADGYGNPVASGTYFFRMTVNGAELTRKLIVLH